MMNMITMTMILSIKLANQNDIDDEMVGTWWSQYRGNISAFWLFVKNIPVQKQTNHNSTTTINHVLATPCIIQILAIIILSMYKPCFTMCHPNINCYMYNHVYKYTIYLLFTIMNNVLTTQTNPMLTVMKHNESHHMAQKQIEGSHQAMHLRSIQEVRDEGRVQLEPAATNGSSVTTRPQPTNHGGAERRIHGYSGKTSWILYSI